VVVAVGGDGTVNEVMQAVVHSETALAVIPCGSGNGLARHVGMPKEIFESLIWIKQRYSVRVDVGRVNGRYFISNAGVGIDALVCRDIRTSWIRGFLMYLGFVSRHYLTYRAPKFRITLDDGEEFEQRGFFLSVANASEFGYRFQIAPKASMLDGEFDVVIVPRLPIYKAFRFVWDGFRKQLRSNPDCIFHKAKRIEIRSNRLKWYQVDGDANDCDQFCAFEIEPNALRLIVPIVPKR
jgi:diacylglycerol kinase (ATP)